MFLCSQIKLSIIDCIWGQVIWAQDIIHLDIDNISHEVLTYPEVYNQLINTFGISVSNLDNKTINRRNLGNIVFNSEKEMDKLTQITWWIQYFYHKFLSPFPLLYQNNHYL